MTACWNIKKMLDKNFLEDYNKRNAIPVNPRRNLTEYLQSEILAALYESKYGRHFSFMGGTCLRFVHKIDRFSEDLDFDLILKQGNPDIKGVAVYIEKKLKELGFAAETRLKERQNIFVIYVKFSEVMKEMGLSGMADQKLTVKFEVDPNPPKKIEIESKEISAYGKTFNLACNALKTLFAQKIIAAQFRPFQKGRDFYDLVWFLLQKDLEPNYDLLLEKKIKAQNREQMVQILKKTIEKADLPEAVADVEKFLFRKEKAKWILNLPKYLDDYAKAGK